MPGSFVEVIDCLVDLVLRFEGVYTKNTEAGGLTPVISLAHHLISASHPPATLLYTLSQVANKCKDTFGWRDQFTWHKIVQAPLECHDAVILRRVDWNMQGLSLWRQIHQRQPVTQVCLEPHHSPTHPPIAMLQHRQIPHKLRQLLTR